MHAPRFSMFIGPSRWQRHGALVMALLMALALSHNANGAESEPGGAAPSSVPVEEGRPMPTSAEVALKQAEAAYEYGDMPLVVESARVVTDGTLRATPTQVEQALRYLGIGLYVTGRLQGAQMVFEQLLQMAPETQLNPATTRPEIITFFYQLRRARIESLREAHRANRPNILLSFLPPLGQFANGHRTKGWVLLVAQAATFITATTTYAIYKSWERDDGTVCEAPELGFEACRDRTETAEDLRTWQLGSSAAFAALYAYGVLDSLISRSREPSQEELLRRGPPPLSVSLSPNGAALSLRF